MTYASFSKSAVENNDYNSLAYEVMDYIVNPELSYLQDEFDNKTVNLIDKLTVLNLDFSDLDNILASPGLRNHVDSYLSGILCEYLSLINTNREVEKCHTDLFKKFSSLKSEYGFSDDEVMSYLNDLVAEKGNLTYRRNDLISDEGEVVSVERSNELKVDCRSVTPRTANYQGNVEFLAELLPYRLEIVGEDKKFVENLTPLPEKPLSMLSYEDQVKYFVENDLVAMIEPSNITEDEAYNLWKDVRENQERTVIYNELEKLFKIKKQEEIDRETCNLILEVYPLFGGNLKLAKKVYDEFNMIDDDDLDEDCTSDLDDIVKCYEPYADILECDTLNLFDSLTSVMNVCAMIPADGCAPEEYESLIKELIYDESVKSCFRG